MNTKPASKPDTVGPVQQFQLLLYASKDTELTACDLAVLAELTDRYLKADGVTRPTSAGHLAKETGRTIRPVQESLTRLAERGYITLAEQGSGTRGNTYRLPFEWVRATWDAIYAVIKEMADAKKHRRRKRGRASYAADSVATPPKLATLRTAYLRSLVTLPTAYLGTLATLSTAPQSYIAPERCLYRDAGTAGGLKPPPPVITKKIVAASVESDDGEQWVEVEFDVGASDFITLESDSASEQEEGQERLARLTSSAGLMGDIESPDELVGCIVHMQGDRYLMPHDVDMRDAA
jgi:hypothetical protein